MQAADHSLAQLELLAAAAQRVQARQGLLDLSIVSAAMSAFAGKDSALRSLSGELRKLSDTH